MNMYKTIALNGTELPVSFSLLMLSRFEDETGISISQLGKGNISLTHALTLAHLALVDGARRAGTEYNNTFEETADMLDQDQGALERIMTAFGDTTPEEKEKKTRAKKRKTPKA